MRLSRFLLLFLLAVAPACVHAQREKLPWDDLEYVNKTWPNAKRTSTGLRYVVLAEGKGDLAKPGEMVSVLFVGRLLNGPVFDRLDDPANPFKFRLGRNEVIEAWDQGLQLMRPGSKYLFIVPAELAYGSRGRSPGIPPDATLVFDVQLIGVSKGP